MIGWLYPIRYPELKHLVSPYIFPHLYTQSRSHQTSHLVSMSFFSSKEAWRSIVKSSPHFIYPIARVPIQSTTECPPTLPRFPDFPPVSTFHKFHTLNNTQSNGKQSRKHLQGRDFGTGWLQENPLRFMIQYPLAFVIPVLWLVIFDP